MKTAIPNDILTQHIAVLGKTGSGKTSTAKLAIEQVVADGARVCVLDPIKSDWWGLTSSADGKHAGLPFHILGGPRGHVPLHAGAGKAIGEIVASGALPLSIIDMADFEPGGQAKFFTDFAPTLLRKMRGVVYLVIEEAHLFAPKERSGVGAENLSIHWAKTLATAGRSKGIRLVLVTQRTQALHNALLGSCDTLIAHRLTAPADQEPVVKWLKANTSKEILDKVSTSLASLKTGDGWICSGEAKVFELVHFPRIHTYDNTATPTGDGDTRVIKTAAVDQEKLRAIIGDAVEQAKADDPRELRKQVAELKRQLAHQTAAPEHKSPPDTHKTVEKPVLTDADRALLEKYAAALNQAVEKIKATTTAQHDALVKDVEAAIRYYLLNIEDAGQRALVQVEKILDGKNFQKIFDKLATVQAPAPPPFAGRSGEPTLRASDRVGFGTASGNQRPAPARPPVVHGSSNGHVSGAEQRILSALAELEALGVTQPERVQVAFFAGYTHLNSKGLVNALGSLRTAGHIDYPTQGRVVLTETGRAHAGTVDAPRSPEEVRDRIVQMLGGASARILNPLISAYPGALQREDLAAQADYGHLNSKGFVNALGRLRSLGFIDYPGPGQVAAQPVLFLESR